LKVTELAARRLGHSGPLSDLLLALIDRELASLPGQARAGEKRIVEGGMRTDVWALILTALSVWAMLLAGAAKIDGTPLTGMGTMVLTWSVLSGVFAALVWATSGTFALTSERTVWRPRFGDEVQRELSTIAPGDLRCNPVLSRVSIRAAAGAPRLELTGIEKSGVLAAEFWTRGFIARQTKPAEGPPAEFIRLRGATRRGKLYNTLLLRPGYAALVRNDPVRAWRAAFPDCPFTGTTEQLMNVLPLLDEKSFDEAVLRVAEATSGIVLRRPTARWSSADEPVRSGVVLEEGSRTIFTRGNWQNEAGLTQFLRRWW
jgi:hypothetical protein